MGLGESGFVIVRKGLPGCGLTLESQSFIHVGLATQGHGYPELAQVRDRLPASRSRAEVLVVLKLRIRAV